MTHDEALESLAAHPHAWRYRQLCADDSDPARRDAYRRLVVDLARGGRPAPAGAPAAAPAPVRVHYGEPAPGRCCGPPAGPIGGAAVVAPRVPG